MARKKHSNLKRSNGKHEAWVYRKQKWFPAKGKPLKVKKIRKRKQYDLSLNPALKEQFEADQKEDDELLVQIWYTYME